VWDKVSPKSRGWDKLQISHFAAAAPMTAWGGRHSFSIPAGLGFDSGERLFGNETGLTKPLSVGQLPFANPVGFAAVQRLREHLQVGQLIAGFFCQAVRDNVIDFDGGVCVGPLGDDRRFAIDCLGSEGRAARQFADCAPGMP
jgi:hypothetical protein